MGDELSLFSCTIQVVTCSRIPLHDLPTLNGLLSPGQYLSLNADLVCVQRLACEPPETSENPETRLSLTNATSYRRLKDTMTCR